MRGNCKTPVWGQIRAFIFDLISLQIAYPQSNMSICNEIKSKTKSSNLASKASFAIPSMRLFFSLFASFVFLLLCLLFFCAGCSSSSSCSSSQWMAATGKVKVLSTTPMIDDLVKRIGKEWIDAEVLIRGNLDPHSYQLVKGDNEKLLAADLIFSNGLGLEHGPSLQRHLHANPKNIVLGDLIIQKEPDKALKVNGSLDPHIWMDVSLWAKAIPYIVSALSLRDPCHAQSFHDNGELLQQELLATHQKIREIMQALPENRRFLVTSHDAFNYFARAYLAAEGETMQQWQSRFAAPEGLAPESQLSTTDIKNIMKHLRRYHVSVLFPESNINKDSLRKIVHAGEKEGLAVTMAKEILYADAMGSPGSNGDSYIKMMMHNATTIAKYLGSVQQ